MQTGILLVCYILTAIVLQFCGFLISQVVDRTWPAAGLLTFVICFLGAYAIAWPIAVLIAEWLIRRAGYVVDTEQSGGTLRRDSLASYNAERRDASR
jgi:hypothetical protein